MWLFLRVPSDSVRPPIGTFQSRSSLMLPTAPRPYVGWRSAELGYCFREEWNNVVPTAPFELMMGGYTRERNHCIKVALCQPEHLTTYRDNCTVQLNQCECGGNSMAKLYPRAKAQGSRKQNFSCRSKANFNRISNFT